MELSQVALWARAFLGKEYVASGKVQNTRSTAGLIIEVIRGRRVASRGIRRLAGARIIRDLQKSEQNRAGVITKKLYRPIMAQWL